jgi:hypothetical protein
MTSKKKTAASRFANIVDEPSGNYPSPAQAVVPEVARMPPPASRAPGRSVTKAAAPATRDRQPGREGKVGIQFWVEPPTRKKLRNFATDNDRSLADLMDEAVADFMRKYKLA